MLKGEACNKIKLGFEVLGKEEKQRVWKSDYGWVEKVWQKTRAKVLKIVHNAMSLTCNLTHVHSFNHKT